MVQKTITMCQSKPISMRVIFNMKKTYQKVCTLALLIILTGCETFTQGQQQPVKPVAKKTELEQPVKQAVAECQCEQAAVKEVIRYVDKPCPKNKSKAAKNSVKPVNPYADKLIVGRVEYVVLSANGLPIKARIDTGAKTSSLNALDMVEFERDGKKWVRFAVMNPATEEKVFFERKVQRYVRIKQMETDYQRRPVVKMGLQLGSVDEFVELTLTDRSDYVYQVLVGRNFLLDRMMVDVSQKYIAQNQVK